MNTVLYWLESFVRKRVYHQKSGCRSSTKANRYVFKDDIPHQL
jgi:hypothetical protein